MVGIYKIENNINHKCYIGQSVKIEKRWNDEINDSKNINSHSYNYPLQQAFREYGENNFSFMILEECERKELNSKERYWVSYYDSFFNGYNQTLGGDTTISQPKEKIIGIINDLKNTDLYHKEIAKKWQISIEMVQGINTGRYWYMDNVEYPLQKYHKEKSHHIVNGQIIDSKKYFCIDCGKEISKGSTRCLNCSSKYQRKVERPNDEELKKLLFSYNGNFTKVSKIYGVSDNSIRKWCKAYGLPTHSSDYKVKIDNSNQGRSVPKKVLQFDLDNNFIAEYNSIAEACRAIGKINESSHISSVCKGKRKTAGGYKWKYSK